MTKKTRYFLLSAVGVLLVGLAGGLIAYLVNNRGPALPNGLPPEVRYVPSTAEVVAFANVQAVMNSELRRELMPTIEAGGRRGRQMMSDFAGVDLEKQVNRVVGYVEPYKPADPQTQGRPEMPRGLMLVQGTFDQARIEQFIRERGGVMEDYNGKKMFVQKLPVHDEEKQVAVGLAAPDLIAIGEADLVRRALDRAAGASSNPQDITTNAEMMNLIRDAAGSTAWVVGQFDAVRRRMHLPDAVSDKVPPVRLMSVKANVNGGMKATIRAETADKAAADQLRDVVRGFVSLARLQGGGTPALDSALKTVELSGTNTTVQMSFALAPDTLRMLTPRGRGGRGRGNPEREK